jgi:hypothetical protein
MPVMVFGDAGGQVVRHRFCGDTVAGWLLWPARLVDPGPRNVSDSGHQVMRHVLLDVSDRGESIEAAAELPFTGVTVMGSMKPWTPNVKQSRF